MTNEEQTAIKTLIEWKRQCDKLMDFQKKMEGQELDAAGEEMKGRFVMDAYRANMLLHEVTAELIESYVKRNPRTGKEIQA